jgi:hypothetical protein
MESRRAAHRPYSTSRRPSKPLASNSSACQTTAPAFGCARSDRTIAMRPRTKPDQQTNKMNPITLPRSYGFEFIGTADENPGIRLRSPR